MKLLKSTKNLVKNVLRKTAKTTLRFLLLAIMLLPAVSGHSDGLSDTYLLKNKRTAETIKAPNTALQITTQIIKKASSISATDGVIKVIINGGQVVYQLQIINSNNQIVFTNSFNTNVVEVANLAAGTYQINLTDGSASEATDSFQMPTENCQLSATLY